jgi:hypothetical protein
VLLRHSVVRCQEQQVRTPESGKACLWREI